MEQIPLFRDDRAQQYGASQEQVKRIHQQKESSMSEQKLDPCERLLQFFSYSHLPDHLRNVSYECFELAESMLEGLPHNPELTVGLRKLLEAKDCFVRAALYNDEG